MWGTTCQHASTACKCDADLKGHDAADATERLLHRGVLHNLGFEYCQPGRPLCQVHTLLSCDRRLWLLLGCNGRKLGCNRWLHMQGQLRLRLRLAGRLTLGLRPRATAA